MIRGKRGEKGIGSSAARRTLRAAAFSLAIVWLLALASPAQAAFPGNNGKIVFSTNPEGTGDRNPWIATVNPDGSGYTRIYYTHAEAPEESPQWSPDGGKIAFGDGFLPWETYGYQLATMNPDGSGVTRISNFPPRGYQSLSGLSWSPDGRKLVTSFEGQLWIVNANGSGQSAIPGTPSGFIPYPDWSPDGSKIAFARWDDGIYTIGPDGSNLVQVTEDPPGRFILFPHWSPDGSRIAFTTGPSPYSMHIVDADGANEVNLGEGAYPDWSPDGTRIVFSEDAYDLVDAYGCLYTMNPDGSDRTQASYPEFNDGCKAWLPDWQPIRPPGYARPKNASPAVIRLVPAQKPCTSPNASHGEPLDVASCSPAQQSSDYLTVGTPDLNGQAANSIGQITMKVLTEAPIDLTNGDQSDVAFTGQISDVRDRQTLLDYLGELRLSFGLRLTDRLNTALAVHPGTAMDATFGFSFGCTPTPSVTVGSTCSVATSADAAVPGITPEFKRAVWQLGEVEVYDGGSDGDGDTTGGNTLFATQGLFVP